jgi:hypothetical protein
MSSVDWSDTDAPQYFEAKKMKQPAETIGETIGEKFRDTWGDETGGYARDMTLRDYYAGLAMQVFLEDKRADIWDDATNAYKMADAMIEERHK